MQDTSWHERCMHMHILKVWRHIKNLIPSIDVYSLEEQLWQITQLSRWSDLKRWSIRLFKSVAPARRTTRTRWVAMWVQFLILEMIQSLWNIYRLDIRDNLVKQHQVNLEWYQESMQASSVQQPDDIRRQRLLVVPTPLSPVPASSQGLHTTVSQHSLITRSSYDYFMT